MSNELIRNGTTSKARPLIVSGLRSARNRRRPREERWTKFRLIQIELPRNHPRNRVVVILADSRINGTPSPVRLRRRASPRMSRQERTHRGRGFECRKSITRASAERKSFLSFSLLIFPLFHPISKKDQLEPRELAPRCTNFCSSHARASKPRVVSYLRMGEGKVFWDPSTREMRVHLEKLLPRSPLGAEIQLSCLASRLHEPLKNLFAVTTMSETKDLPLRHVHIASNK